MDCGYLRAGVLVGVGAGLRSLVAYSILRAAGLGTGWEEGFLMLESVGIDGTEVVGWGRYW